MNIYPIIREILFKLDAEKSHNLTLRCLKLFSSKKENIIKKTNPINLMGIDFPNKIGLAAGLDKNGQYINELSRFGFGFIEIGTVTPVSQAGNEKPRLFRIPKKEAIINRMGFNNKGVDYLIKQVKKSNYKGVLGINIGKNASTKNENACADYIVCLKKVYKYADYITINISSPNTKNLRDLQNPEALEYLFKTLKLEQEILTRKFNKKVPLVIKIAPDLTLLQINKIADLCLKYKIEGLNATNTTIDKTLTKKCEFGNENGGLSGSPLLQKSNLVLEKISKKLKNKVVLFGVGGVSSSQDAQNKIDLGADLVQVYSGLIYKGKKLINEIVKSQSIIK